MATRRRTYQTHPDLGLLAIDSIAALDARVVAMATDSGLGEDGLIATLACPVPFPDYELRDLDSLRWPGVEAAFMWHPLMWLPAEDVARREIEVSSGAFVSESDEQMSTRLALLCLSSTLYDSADGTWMDVLSSVGLDIDSAADLERVGAWLDGAEDEALDGVDLSELTSVAAEAHEIGDAIFELVEGTGMHVAAAESTQIIEEAGRGGGDERHLRGLLDAVVSALGDYCPASRSQEIAALRQRAAAQPLGEAGEEILTWLAARCAEHSEHVTALTDMFSAPEPSAD